MSRFPRVEDGVLLLYRLFDVADDIDLARAERLLAGEGERLRLTGERTGFLDLPDRPLSVALGPRAVPLEGSGPVPAAAHVRLFAHGVASVRYEVPLPAPADAAAIAALVKAAADSAALERDARREAHALADRLSSALSDPHESPIFETYAVVFARRLESGGVAADAEGSDLARVLLGEPPSTAVSPQTVADVTRHRFSWTEADLCVLDWDAAFVVEPGGDRAVADVLEVVSAQLLEFRYYDDLSERELVRGAETLSRRRRGVPWPFSTRQGRDLRRLQNLVVESVEFTESVENAVRVVGDLYLARIYRAAVERFRIPVWQAGVARRQEAAVQVAGLLASEASAARGHLLEATILALIVLEILLAVTRGG